jgi:two-component system, NarL family, sensor kinase
MSLSSNDIILLVLLTVLIFLLAGVFLVLYVNLYNKRKKRHIEERAFLQKKFEDELVQTQIEVQEHTLKTIASEIHDNVGQLLSLSKLTLGTVNVRKSPEKAEQKLQSALALIDTSIKELRQLSSVLYADNLLAVGLESAIEKELHWLGRSGQFRIDWSCNDEYKRQVDPQKALIAFRIIQELLNNIVKHAEAGSISVNFEYTIKEVIVHVQDDGKGFDISNALAMHRGLGLTSLFKRANMIGGELTLTSEPAIGTTAILKFPY